MGNEIVSLLTEDINESVAISKVHTIKPPQITELNHARVLDHF